MKSWHRKASKPITWWMMALVIAGLVHIGIPQYRWVLIHMFTLGVLTNSIMLWSHNFTEKWMHSSPSDQARKHLVIRTYATNIGIILTVLGKIFWWPVLLVGAAAIIAMLLWHAFDIFAQLDRKQRFSHAVLAYLASAFCLIISAGLGAYMAYRPNPDILYTHLVLNFGGFVGLAALGSLSVLFPAIWRSKIKWDLSRYGLALAVLGLVIAAFGIKPGLFVYAAGWLVSYVGFVRGIKLINASFAGLSVLIAPLWLMGSVVKLGFTDQLPTLGLLVGFAAQLLIGVMSYLLPTTIGGGSRAVRAGMLEMNRAGIFRTGIINGGLLLWIFGQNSWLKVVASLLVCLALAYILVATPLAVKAQRAVLMKKAEGPESVEKPKWGQLTAALATIALLMAAFVPTPSQTSTVAASAETTRVEVSMHSMMFHPNSIDVPKGNRLVIVATNNDTQVHDLVIENGATTGRVNPGETKELDAGIIGGSQEAWCSIAGHRMQGMTIQINAGDEVQAAPKHASNKSTPLNSTDIDPNAVVDPTVPASTTHEMTIDVQELKIPVGVNGEKRARWTFNGGLQGPILRGKVGDEFNITFKNSGTMAHSLDFHAGLVAPDQVMRNINPGETLQYKFRANRSGIWLYHCGTMPMSMHVAAGMFGAVIIDPPDLAPVDHEFLMVQSEVYGFGDQPVDDQKLAEGKPDAVVFNGLENQYVTKPLEMKEGETARFWLLNAGPNLALSFHIVGGQFHTTYKEGAYLLRGTDGGSQSLDLLAAQGGFVEGTFPEAGTYTMVNHQFIDAERGARGKIVVKPK